jgi:hypothetical protein
VRRNDDRDPNAAVFLSLLTHVRLSGTPKYEEPKRFFLYKFKLLCTLFDNKH